MATAGLQPGHLTALRRASDPNLTSASAFIDTIHTLARNRVLPVSIYAPPILHRLETAHTHNLHDAARIIHACARLQLRAQGRALVAGLDPALPHAALATGQQQQRRTLAHALTSLLWACAALDTPPAAELRHNASRVLSTLHGMGTLDNSALLQVWAATDFAATWQRARLVDDDVWDAAQEARRGCMHATKLSALQRDVTLQVQRLVGDGDGSVECCELRGWEVIAEGRLTPLIKADILLRAVRGCFVA